MQSGRIRNRKQRDRIRGPALQALPAGLYGLFPVCQKAPPPECRRADASGRRESLFGLGVIFLVLLADIFF